MAIATKGLTHQQDNNDNDADKLFLLVLPPAAGGQSCL